MYEQMEKKSRKVVLGLILTDNKSAVGRISQDEIQPTVKAME